MKNCTTTSEENLLPETLAVPNNNSRHWKEFKREDLSCKNLPWLGSYFDIPEPETTNPVKSEFVLVMEVLMKDMSVKTYRLALTDYRNDFAGVNWENDAANLRRMAYGNPDAIALMLYSFGVNSETGKEKITFGHLPQRRINNTIWKTVDHHKMDLEEEEFSTESAVWY